MFRCDDIGTTPVVDPVGTVVFHASVKQIDTVLINGRAVKRGGELVGVDYTGLCGEVQGRSERHRREAGGVDIKWAGEFWRGCLEGSSSHKCVDEKID